MCRYPFCATPQVVETYAWGAAAVGWAGERLRPAGIHNGVLPVTNSVYIPGVTQRVLFVNMTYGRNNQPKLVLPGNMVLDSHHIGPAPPNTPYGPNAVSLAFQALAGLDRQQRRLPRYHYAGNAALGDVLRELLRPNRGRTLGCKLLGVLEPTELLEPAALKHKRSELHRLVLPAQQRQLSGLLVGQRHYACTPQRLGPDQIIIKL
jgi:hypothetical protein